MPQTFLKFFRLELRDSVIYSHEYTRPTKRNDYTVMFSLAGTQKEFGQVECFVEAIGEQNQLQVLALICPFTTTIFSVSCGSSEFPVNYLLESTTANHVKFIPVTHIERKCICLEVSDKMYVVQPVHDICMQLST